MCVSLFNKTVDCRLRKLRKQIRFHRSIIHFYKSNTNINIFACLLSITLYINNNLHKKGNRPDHDWVIGTVMRKMIKRLPPPLSAQTRTLNISSKQIPAAQGDLTLFRIWWPVLKITHYHIIHVRSNSCVRRCLILLAQYSGYQYNDFDQHNTRLILTLALDYTHSAWFFNMSIVSTHPYLWPSQLLIPYYCNKMLITTL